MLANKVFGLHTLVTLAGCGWGLVVSQLWLVAVLAVLWLLTTIVFFEFKNSY